MGPTKAILPHQVVKHYEKLKHEMPVHMKL